MPKLQSLRAPLIIVIGRFYLEDFLYSNFDFVYRPF